MIRGIHSFLMRRTYGALFVRTMALLLALSALENNLASEGWRRLTIPCRGTLSGKLLDLPAVARDKVAVAIFSFSRTGGRDARNWAQHFSNDYPQLAIYNVIFLESVPQLFRPMVVSRIESGMPPGMQDRTQPLYQQQISWEQMLHVKDENYAMRCGARADRTYPMDGFGAVC